MALTLVQILHSIEYFFCCQLCTCHSALVLIRSESIYRQPCNECSPDFWFGWWPVGYKKHQTEVCAGHRKAKHAKTISVQQQQHQHHHGKQHSLPLHARPSQLPHYPPRHSGLVHSHKQPAKKMVINHCRWWARNIVDSNSRSTPCSVALQFRFASFPTNDCFTKNDFHFLHCFYSIDPERFD